MNTSPNRPTTFDDIETGPEPEEVIRKFTDPYPGFDVAKTEAAIRRKYVTANDPVKGPKFLSDKVEEARAEHAEKEEEYWQKVFDKAALNPLVGRVLAIGIRKDGQNTIIIAENDAEEKAALQTYLNNVTEVQAQGGEKVGFNLDDFDTRFLVARCMKYHLDWRILRNGRYPAAVFHDMLNDWRGGDKTKFISLDKLAEFLGTKHRKNGDGAHFHEVLKTDRAKAIDYLGNDLVMTEEVGVGLGVVPERVYELKPNIVIQSSTPADLAAPGEDLPFGEQPAAPRPLPVPRKHAPELAAALAP